MSTVDCNLCYIGKQIRISLLASFWIPSLVVSIVWLYVEFIEINILNQLIKVSRKT